jgi:hypothetical protein
VTEHDTLAAALVAALSDMTVVEKSRTAKIEKKAGGYYSYDFADIADVVKLTRPVLAEHGIVALTPVHDHGDGLACTVTLVHVSGDRLDLGPFPFPHGRDAQATGSMVTYHRRYALVAALGIAAGDDDDGAEATAAARRPAMKEEPPIEVPDGDSVGVTKTKLRDYLAAKIEGDPTEHAKTVWQQAEVKTTKAHIGSEELDWVAPAEFVTLIEVADEYVKVHADEPVQESPADA